MSNSVPPDLTGAPHDFFPDLAPDRLDAICDAIAPIYSEAMDDHESDKGDGNCTRGIRLYERTKWRLERFAPTTDWMHVATSNNECALLVGDVPIKFGYDDPTNIRRRRRRVSRLEQQLRQPTLFGDPLADLPSVFDGVPPLLRLIIQGRVNGGVSISLGAYSRWSSSPMAAWRLLDDDGADSSMQEVGLRPTPPSSMPPVEIELRGKGKADAEWSEAGGIA